MTPVGIVHLIGAGPGDPGLLTVRGRDLLERCDAVVFDALANPVLLALVPRNAERHDVGKRGGEPDSARQDEINALLVRLARAGKRVARLKGGDPLVFGRGSEEAQALSHAGVEFEIVPGVTAGVAAAAYAGIPVTHRGVATSVTFVTGHEDPTKGPEQVDWQALARVGGSIVLYMGVKALPRIAEALIAGGMSAETPAAAVQWGTYPSQRTVMATLGVLADRVREAKLSAPVITIIGPVVALRPELAWFERRPLFGARIVVTRAQDRVHTLSDKLAELGAEVIEMPVTRIEPLDGAPIQKAIARLADYQWMVFTSQNAVEFFWRALREQGRDARALGGMKIAAIGPATTRALLQMGIVVDVMPERFVAEGLLELLEARDDVRGSQVLYVAARGAREVLPMGLRDLGAKVDVVSLYESVPDASGAAALRARLLDGGADVVTFTSASAVRAFVDAVGADAAVHAQLVSIGPVTSEAIRATALHVHAEADESTLDGLVRAVVASRATSR